jgi:hypothetical protein
VLAGLAGGLAAAIGGTVVLLLKSASSTSSTLMPSGLASRSPIWRSDRRSAGAEQDGCMQHGGARYPDPEPAFLRAPYRQGSLDDRMTTAGCSRNFRQRPFLLLNLVDHLGP